MWFNGLSENPYKNENYTAIFSPPIFDNDGDGSSHTHPYNIVTKN